MSIKSDLRLELITDNYNFAWIMIKRQ